MSGDAQSAEKVEQGPGDCHPRCSLEPRTDHPGYLGYRCITDMVDTLPWPGEDGYEDSLTPPAGSEG